MEEIQLERYGKFKKNYNELKKISSDLEYPIQDYYGTCSHNTYLIEHAKPTKGINAVLSNILTHTTTNINQLVGKASEEQYMNVLMEGCRQVELDVFDGRKTADGYEPIITHGGTLVNYITLRSVLERITDFAVAKKDFSPIVLNIENNCTNNKTNAFVSGCRVVSSIIQEVWPKNNDFKPDHCTCKDTRSFMMSKYYGKILIRDSEKKHYDPNPVNDTLDENLNNLDQPNACDDSDSVCDEYQHDKINHKSNKSIEISIKKMSRNDQARLDIFSDNCISFNSDMCGCHTKSINFSDMKTQLQIKKIKSKIIDNKNQINCFIQKTKTITTRTYPPGIHIASANFDPIICMSFGINCTALNYQMNDKYKAIYMAFFSDSNGYLLKPYYLRSDLLTSDVFDDLDYRTISIESVDNSPYYISLYTGFLTYSKNGTTRSNRFANKNTIQLNICRKEIEISVIYVYDQNNYACLPLRQLIFNASGQAIRLRLMTHQPKNISYDDVVDTHIDNGHNVYPKISDDFKYYYLKHIIPDKYVDVMIRLESD